MVVTVLVSGGDGLLGLDNHEEWRRHSHMHPDSPYRRGLSKHLPLSVPLPPSPGPLSLLPHSAGQQLHPMYAKGCDSTGYELTTTTVVGVKGATGNIARPSCSTTPCVYVPTYRCDFHYSLPLIINAPCL